MACFNEAGAVMPRKDTYLPRAEWAPPRFNEAGAVMPRKGRFQRDNGSANLGFNEAGAVMPRKGRGRPINRGPQSRASMRPGLLCPGKF